MTDQLDSFDTRLLAELREHVSENADQRGDSPKLADLSTRRRFSPRILVAAAGVTAAAVTGIVFLPGLGAQPAYSVQEGNSGTITVQVNRPENAAGLEQRLAEHGITSDITYVPGAQQCAPGRYTPITDPRGMTLEVGADRVQVILQPGAVREGETFVLSLSYNEFSPEQLREMSRTDGRPRVRTVEGFSSSVDFDVTAGPVGPCLPVPTEN